MPKRLRSVKFETRSLVLLLAGGFVLCSAVATVVSFWVFDGAGDV